MLSSEQAAFLINMGLLTMVQAGSAKVKDMSEEEFIAEAKKAGEKKEEPSPATAQDSFIQVDDDNNNNKKLH